MAENRFLSLWLVAATSLLSVADTRAPAVDNAPDSDPVAYLMSDAYKAKLFSELTQGTVPPDAVAQIDPSADKRGVINLDSVSSVDMNHLIAVQNDYPDNAGLNFTSHDKMYKIMARDMLQLNAEYELLIARVAPGTTSYVTVNSNGTYQLACEFDKDMKFVMTGIDVSAFVYWNRNGFIAAAAHEAGHYRDRGNPRDDMAVTRDNEFRADSMAAELTSPAQVGLALRQIATCLQFEDRSGVSPAAARPDLNSVQNFGFANSKAVAHPGLGRRIQYLEMLSLYRNGCIDRPRPPPEQRFAPTR